MKVEILLDFAQDFVLLLLLSALVALEDLGLFVAELLEDSLLILDLVYSFFFRLFQLRLDLCEVLLVVLLAKVLHSLLELLSELLLQRANVLVLLEVDVEGNSFGLLLLGLHFFE